MDALVQLQFTTPTPIQAKVIPSALEGKDVLGCAQTGTGKTAAFGIPLISHLIQNTQDLGLVMAPTRELALQVVKMLEGLLGKQRSVIKTALLIGGEPIYKQFKQLDARPRLIVGTPGRINDHLQRGKLKLNAARFLVLDEADRMLDMGFAPQIEGIVDLMPEERQTLLFSATLPKNIMFMVNKYLRDPVRVTIGETSTPLANLKQEVIHVSEDEKYGQLTNELGKRDGSIIVFVKTKIGAEKMAKRLRLEEHCADAIHGDLSHQRRERAISGFRTSKYRIMVATDIAARGLDISHVKHVINYDLPQCPEDYIHRIGRTARAGAEGSALCFVTPSDRFKWNAIHRLINPEEKAPFPKSPFPRSQRSSSAPYSDRKRSPFGSNNRSSNSSSGYRTADHRDRRPSSDSRGGSYGRDRFASGSR